MGRLHGLVLALAALPAAAQPSARLQAALRSVDWTPARTDRFIREMPKAELHLHLDGALSPATALKLAKRQRYAPLQDLSVEQVSELTVVDAARPSLADVLRAFGAVYPLLRRADAVELAAYEAVRAASKDRTRYLEARFAPVLQSSGAFTAEKALQAALKGLARGKRDFGVDSGVILCLLRPDSLMSMEGNRQTLELALRYQGRGVVGMDLAGDEAAAPLALYAPLLERAKKAGLGLTVHAGEVPDSLDLKAAVALGADRIGHATLLERDPEALAAVKDRRIPIEVNLTSNLRTSAVKSLAAHPAKRWHEAGIPLAVSTDDPGVFAIDLVGEYRLLRDELGFAPADLLAVSLQAVDAAFLPPRRKTALRERFEREALNLLDSLAKDSR